MWPIFSPKDAPGHLKVNKVAIEVVQLRQPELVTSEVERSSRSQPRR